MVRLAESRKSHVVQSGVANGELKQCCVVVHCDNKHRYSLLLCSLHITEPSLALLNRFFSTRLFPSVCRWSLARSFTSIYGSLSLVISCQQPIINPQKVGICRTKLIQAVPFLQKRSSTARHTDTPTC